MQCQQCGAVLPDGEPACPACGLRFFVPGDVPETQPLAAAAAAAESAALSAATPPDAAETPESPVPDAGGDGPAPHVEGADEADTESPAGAPPSAKPRVGRTIAIVIAVVALLGAAATAAVLILVPARVEVTPVPAGAYAPVKVDTSISATATPVGPEADKAAAEKAVVTFYQTIDSGDATAVAALVTSDTQSAVDAGALEGWSSPTTFTVVRSAVETDTAFVFGHESQRAFGSKTLGVKFTLQRIDGTWFIQSWQAVDEGIVNGAMPSTGQGAGATLLTASTARDLVDTLLQARQQGDAETIRLLTTAAFQKANGAAWLDGVDNTPYFTKYTIRSVRKRGAAFVATVREVWNSGTETATYRVIEASGTVLVDSWTSK